jgi:hypothetical protein
MPNGHFGLIPSCGCALHGVIQVKRLRRFNTQSINTISYVLMCAEGERTPKEFNMNNPLQATGADRGKESRSHPNSAGVQHIESKTNKNLRKSIKSVLS